MTIRDLIPWGRSPWGRSGSQLAKTEDNPVAAMQREINRMFDTFWDRFPQPVAGNGAFNGALPRTDVAETDNEVEVTIELPGLEEKDVEVSIANDVLTIRGEKKNEREEKRKDFYLAERSYGAFHRSIPLPPGVDSDKAKAEFAKGILKIALPKTAEAQSRVKKIAVKAA